MGRRGDPVKMPDLGQMLGPLPLGAWVGVAGGGVGLAYVARRKGGGGGGGDDDEVVAPLVPVFPATPTTAGPTALSPSVPEVAGTPIGNNSEWIAAGVRALASRGFAPYTTQQCLARYLEGVIQGGDCVAIVDQAIGAIGPPPDGAPVNQTPIVASAPPTPPSSPTRQGTITVTAAVWAYPDNSKPAGIGARAFVERAERLRREGKTDVRVVSTRLVPGGTEATITYLETT